MSDLSTYIKASRKYDYFDPFKELMTGPAITFKSEKLPCTKK